MQSTTFDASTACVAVPLTVTRALADGMIGRLTPLIVRFASDEIRLTPLGVSVTTLVSDITSGNCGLPKPPVFAWKPCSLTPVAPWMLMLLAKMSWKFGYSGPDAGSALVL